MCNYQFICVCCECSGKKPSHVLIQIYHGTTNNLQGSQICKKLVYFQCYKCDVYYKCILQFLSPPSSAGTKLISPSNIKIFQQYPNRAEAEFLQSRNCFCYITENKSKGDILGWTLYDVLCPLTQAEPDGDGQRLAGGC